MRLITTTLGAGFLALLNACGSGSSGGSGSGFLQLVNGMPDSPGLMVEIELEDDAVATDSSFGFQSATALLAFEQETYEIIITYEDHDTEFEELLLRSEVDVRRGIIYTAVLAGTFADPTLRWTEKDEGDVTAIDSEDIELQVINLSNDSVAVYLGDAGDGLNAETQIGIAAPGVTTSPLLVAHDEDADYRNRVTLDGDATIIYDSGEIVVPEAVRRSFVITEPQGPDPSAKSVFVVTDAGTQLYPNEVARSGLRVVNAVADAFDADILVRTPATNDVLQEALLPFPAATPYTSVDASFVEVEVIAPAGVGTSTSATVSLNEDTFFTVVVAGSSVAEDLSIRASETTVRSVATATQLQFINTLTDTDDEDSSEVDFYALALGEALSDTAPVASRVDYLEAVDALLPATAYDLVITTSGTQSILAGPVRVVPPSGSALLVLAAEGFGGSLPNQLVVLEDGE